MTFHPHVTLATYYTRRITPKAAVRRDSPLPDESMHPHEAEDAHHALREDIEYVLKTAANLSPLVEGTRKVEEHRHAQVFAIG